MLLQSCWRERAARKVGPAVEPDKHGGQQTTCGGGPRSNLANQWTGREALTRSAVASAGSSAASTLPLTSASVGVRSGAGSDARAGTVKHGGERGLDRRRLKRH